MRIIHVAAATSLLIASLVDAAPTQKVPGKQLPGLENIKHVVFFMQVKEDEESRTSEKMVDFKV